MVAPASSAERPATFHANAPTQTPHAVVGEGEAAAGAASVAGAAVSAPRVTTAGGAARRQTLPRGVRAEAEGSATRTRTMNLWDGRLE